MSTAKWAKPEYIKKMMRAAKSGKVRFAFTTGKQGDLLMMDDTLEPKKLLANAKSESGNTKGCAGEAWLDGSSLILQSESPVSGLKKKFIALAKENELPVKACKVLSPDGTEIAEAGEAAAQPPVGQEEWSPPEAPPMPGVSLGAAGLDPRFNLPTPDLGVVAEGINQDVKGAAAQVEKALPKELEDLWTTYQMMTPLIKRSSVAELVADIRTRFPNAPVGPDLLKFAQKLKMKLGDGLNPANALKDPLKAIEEGLQAEFLANLPSSVKFAFSGGVVTLTKDGAALDTSVAGADIDAVAGPDGLKLNLKKGGAVIRVENSSLTKFDPKLRATFTSIEQDAKTVGELEADLNTLKLKIEDERKVGKTTANLEVDFKKLEGELSLKRKTLDTNIEAVVKASTEGVVASLKQIREETKDRKTGLELEVSTKEMVAKFKAWKQTPDLKAALDIVATGKSISAKLEIEAAKTGTVVTADFEALLNNLKANLALVADKGNTKVSADLIKKADEITASLEVVRKTKDLKLAAKLETDFQSVRGKLEAEVKAGNLTAKASLTGDSAKGTVGGSIGIEAVLAKGLSIPAVGAGNLNFKANVSDKGYSVGLSFSIGDPPDPASIKGLFDDADAGIKKVYEMARDPKVRSIQDAQQAANEVSTALKPVTSAVSKMKAMDKQKFSMALNVGLEGGWPVGGKVSPPIPTLGFTVRF